MPLPFARLMRDLEIELRVVGSLPTVVVTGHSSSPNLWLYGTQNPGHLALEMQWIGAFLDAAAEDGFSLDVSRAFMNAGAQFISLEHSFPMAQFARKP